MRKITFLRMMFITTLLICSALVSGQATLPFSYDAGSPSGIAGLTQTGLGSNYSSSPKMKFDTQGDMLVLNFNATPGTLTFDIKWNQSSSAARFPGDFTVMESADGTNYTTIQQYNSTLGQALTTGTTVSQSFSNLLSATRYIKWVYTTKTNGNIALGNITLASGASATAAVAPTMTFAGTQRATDDYWNNATVALETTTADATIYYTTNGDDPTVSSTQYTIPFSISSTSTIKAIAVKSGLDNSTITSKLITISTPPVASIPYTEAFNNTLGSWTSYQVVGAKPVLAQTTGAYFNGYGGGDVETWFVSPQFTAPASGLSMVFDYASKYIGNALVVKYSTDYIGYGSPVNATWNLLKTIDAPSAQDNNYTVKSSGNLVSTVSGATYFALVYDVAAAPYSDFRITNMNVATVTSSIALSDNQTQVGAANVIGGTPKHLLASFRAKVSYVSTVLNKADFLLDGTYHQADITGFKLWYNSTNNFATASQLGTTQPSTAGVAGNGEVISFASLSQSIAAGDTAFVWVTADISSNAVSGRTIRLATSVTDLTFASGTKSGTLTDAGVQTILVPTISVTEVEIPAFSATQGNSDTEVIHVSGTNLTDTIGLAISGTNSDKFALSTNTITQTNGTAATTDVTITYTPGEVANHTATLTLTSPGATPVIFTLTGQGQTATAISNPSASLQISVVDGKIKFSAVKGEVVSIYNSVGQNVLSTLAVDGFNTIAVPAKGVVLVKVGSRFAKVVLK